ncbi:hypothetical protein WMY93_004376 [Mugilogobius chulae]|uniref:Uncharacterized protein n=1 Tax=Mugilogobius chulae TaxID=88201 RepID=A0AAW0PUQ8_9GOBI
MEDLDPLFGSDELEAGLATEPPSQDDYSDSDDELISLSSDVADADVEQFTLTQAERPCVSATGSSGAQSPSPSQDLHQVCRRAAEKLGLKWPEAPAETARSRYEGRRLPTARSSAKQLLPVFPECLEEATQSWSNPLTAKTPAQGGAVLDWDGMEEKGFSHLPPIEPLVASHLYPRKSMTAAGPALPSKADCLQTTLTEKSYKAVATSMRALNASSMLLAYQAELQDDMNSSPDPVVWDELCVVTDLCLRLHRCAVQACGRAMGVMVTQERARWLNLSSLSHREKTQLLDVPVDPKGLFGSLLPPCNNGYTDTLKPQALVQDPLSPIEGAVAPQMDQTDALGPLAQHITQWHSCGASNWVLKTVTRGYRLQFASVPPKFNGVLLSQPREEEAPILQKEIESLKDKGAIRIVPVEHCQTGFYSRYFLVPKKGGGRRPILDLRALNKYMRT